MEGVDAVYVGLNHQHDFDSFCRPTVKFQVVLGEELISSGYSYHMASSKTKIIFACSDELTVQEVWFEDRNLGGRILEQPSKISELKIDSYNLAEMMCMN